MHIVSATARCHRPGTGKTTVARLLGSVFMSLGILATDEVVECSAGDFVTGYANQVGRTTRHSTVISACDARTLSVWCGAGSGTGHSFLGLMDSMCVLLCCAHSGCWQDVGHVQAGSWGCAVY
jgi:hypothetical protein